MEVCLQRQWFIATGLSFFPEPSSSEESPCLHCWVSVRSFWFQLKCVQGTLSENFVVVVLVITKYKLQSKLQYSVFYDCRPITLLCLRSSFSPVLSANPLELPWLPAAAMLCILPVAAPREIIKFKSMLSLYNHHNILVPGWFAAPPLSRSPLPFWM